VIKCLRKHQSELSEKCHQVVFVREVIVAFLYSVAYTFELLSMLYRMTREGSRWAEKSGFWNG